MFDIKFSRIIESLIKKFLIIAKILILTTLSEDFEERRFPILIFDLRFIKIWRLLILSGRHYDFHGQLNSWWLPQTEDEFETRAECFREQYNNFHIRHLEQFNLTQLYVNDIQFYFLNFLLNREIGFIKGERFCFRWMGRIHWERTSPIQPAFARRF